MLTAAWLAPTGAPSAAAPAASLPFLGHGSVGEAYTLGAAPGTRLTLVDQAGATVGSGVADRLGSLVVRNVPPGTGFRFEERTGAGSRRTAPFAVLSTRSAPSPSFYSSQHLHAGLNYVRMRDGILLAATVRLPPGKTLADGPFPTVIEYSGYAVGGPHSLITALEGGGGTKDPLLPDTATVVGSVIAPLMGFATVSLQMRGTGCSGGAFDLFGLPSDYDGYDAVQTVGAQPWVLHHKVGMVGISYSGFSQLVVVGTDPPDLAAITPLSPTDDLYSTGYPGGMYNDGFAASWVAQRVADAQPAPRGGQPWAAAEIAAGDTTCLANQRLHAQAQSLATLVSPDLARTPALFDQRSPRVWASHITVPVFLVGALEDEEVGPQWPSLVSALERDKKVYVTIVNGTHTDSLGPDTISRWLEFLDLYVAGRVPSPSPTLTALAPVLYESLTDGAKSVAPPPCASRPSPRWPPHRRPSRKGIPAYGCSSTTAAAASGPGPCSPPTRQGSRRGRRRAPSRASPSVRAAPSPRGPRPRRPPPPSGRIPPPARPTTCPAPPTCGPPSRPTTGRPSRLRTGSVRDARLPHGDHDRRTRQPQPLPEVDGSRHRSAGDRHRGPSRRGAKGVRHVGLPAQQRPGPLNTSTPLGPIPTYLAADRRALPPRRFALVRIPVDPIAHTFRRGTRRAS